MRVDLSVILERDHNYLLHLVDSTNLSQLIGFGFGYCEDKRVILYIYESKEC